MALLAVFAFCSTAHAEEPAACSFPAVPYYGGLIGLDVLTQEIHWTSPPDARIQLRETNPVVRAMPGRPGRIALGVAEATALVLVDRHLERHHHRGWAKALRISTGVLQAWAIGTNLYLDGQVEGSRKRVQ